MCDRFCAIQRTARAECADDDEQADFFVSAQSLVERQSSGRTEKVVIIGGGPAGLSAALYAARSGLSPVLIAPAFGGQLLAKGADVENYPGRWVAEMNTTLTESSDTDPRSEAEPPEVAFDGVCRPLLAIMGVTLHLFFSGVYGGDGTGRGIIKLMRCNPTSTKKFNEKLNVGKKCIWFLHPTYY